MGDQQNQNQNSQPSNQNTDSSSPEPSSAFPDYWDAEHEEIWQSMLEALRTYRRSLPRYNHDFVPEE